MYWYIKIADSKNNKFNDILNDIITSKSIGIDYGIDKNYNDYNTITDWNNYLKSKCSSNKQYLALKNIFNTFINDIKVGDIVFLCSGINKIHYVCQIDSTYEFDNTYINKYNNGTSLCHRRKINHITKFDSIAPKKMRATIYKV
jgi:predicted Mrr-cat superfamily restriction endonuclease